MRREQLSLGLPPRKLIKTPETYPSLRLLTKTNEDNDDWGSDTFLSTTIELEPGGAEGLVRLLAEANHPSGFFGDYFFDIQFKKEVKDS